ncbi:MAG: tetratricopeptide repeat protein [Verrucomicrobiota bacterium]
MKHPFTKTLFGCVASVLFAILIVPADVRGQDSIEVLYNKSIAAMNEGNWEEGLKLCDSIIAEYGEFALPDYGPMFGGIYYNKGFCEMKLKEYAKAAESFKTSNETFYNLRPDDPRGDVRESINPYEKRAVFQWALCEQLAQNYEEALKLYEKFQSLNPDPDEFEPGAYFINLAICQSNVGQMAEAKGSLKRVFDNQVAYKVKTPSLIQGFFHLGMAWVKKGAEDPKVMVGANEFLDDYMARLRLRAWEMQRYNPLIVQLAQQAGQAKQFEFALRVYSLYAGLEDAKADLLDRASEYGGVTEKLQIEIDKIDEELAKPDPLDVNVLRGIAACYDGVGDLEAYYILYQDIERRYQDSAERPAILFGATRGAAGTGDVEGTQRYGLEFIENFPTHELYDQVSSLMIGTLFQEREYETCIEIALDVRDTLDEGSKARDIIEFILGGSYYYLTQYEEAQPVLDGHVEVYPNSPYVVNSRYFQPSNLMKMDQYDKAAVLFDSYIADFPESPLLDVALFERALCEYILQDENFDRALELIERLENEFPGSTVLDSALVLKGDILVTIEDYAGAEEAYAGARTAAEALGNADEASNALSKLVDVLVKQEKWEGAGTAYDEFFAQYPESDHRIKVAVSGMDALIQLDRTVEGLDCLEDIIVEVSKEEDSEGLEAAINSYVTISKDEIGVDATIQKLDNYDGLDESKALLAWVLISKIELLEGLIGGLDEGDPELAKRQDAIDKSFAMLREYERAELSNYILLALGRYIATTDNPFLAVDWFEEILGRPSSDIHPFALVELAKIEAGSKDAAELAKAEERFRRVIDVYQTKELLREAYLGLMDLYLNKEDWEKLYDSAEKFLENRNNRTGRPKANFMIARAYEGKGELGRAQQAYLNVYVLFKAYLDWGPRAMLRNANIEWEKGTDAGKLAAYRMLLEVQDTLGHLVGEPNDDWLRMCNRRLDEILETPGMQEMIATDDARIAEEKAAKQRFEQE